MILSIYDKETISEIIVITFNMRRMQLNFILRHTVHTMYCLMSVIAQLVLGTTIRSP